LAGSTLMRQLEELDQRLGRFARATVLALATCGVIIVGGIDYLTGYEVSVSLFYLGPVALATWYGGPGIGVGIAILSCVSWYIAELAAGSEYSNAAIPVWNALVRFGFFLVTSLLLTAIQRGLLIQRRLARTDSLTELYGRRAFDDRLKHDLALARRHNSPLSLAYLDLDNFKAVNDARGHAEGDRVLQAVGRVLQGSVREADTAARMGGDEFALVLPDTDSRGAREVASKISAGLREALGEGPPRVSCSIGVTTFLDAEVSAEQAVQAADALMYQVKRTGKGAVAFRVLGEAPQPRAPADSVR